MIIDLIEEIYVSMSRNKLRIALTGFSIAWGIFLLIVLLGAGNGLLHGMLDNFASQTVNKVHLWPGRTSVELDGLPKGREIRLELRDVEYLRGRFPHEIAAIQPRIEAYGQTLAVGTNHVTTSLTGVYPEALRTGDLTIVAGRSLNDIDMREQRKVMLMHQKTAERLYGDATAALDDWISTDNLKYHVVGIYKTTQANRDDDTYIPLTTAATIYKPDGRYSQVTLLVDHLETAEANEDFNRALRNALAHHLQFEPTDRRALWIWNSYEDYLKTKKALDGIQLFIWIIGIATLIAGVTGISNIMLITVRERTHEFGIRKAIGARPAEIVRLVLLESVAITLVFGYIGLLLGLGLTELANFILTQASQSAEEGFSVFRDPTVDLSIVLMATAVMVVAGVIAGYVPAKRAVSIKPIEALAAS